MESPVKPSDDRSFESSDETSSESGSKSPSGEKFAKYMNIFLEFKEDGKVVFAPSNGSKEMSYSDNHAKENGNCYISINGESENTLTGVVEDDTTNFNIFGISSTFTKQ